MFSTEVVGDGEEIGVIRELDVSGQDSWGDSRSHFYVLVGRPVEPTLGVLY